MRFFAIDVLMFMGLGLSKLAEPLIRRCQTQGDLGGRVQCLLVVFYYRSGCCKQLSLATQMRRVMNAKFVEVEGLWKVRISNILSTL